MTEAASQTNTPVQAESTIKAEGRVSWDQLESVDIPDAAPRKRAEKPERGPAKGEKSAPKAEPKADAVGDEEKDAPKKGESKDTNGDSGSKDDKAKDEKSERKTKAKVHKVRSGESVIDVPSDSLHTITVDGKDEELSYEELRSRASGNIKVDRELSKLDVAKKEHQKTVESMNSIINNLVTKASENPDEGFDFLADLTGKDPVDFKMNLIRAQIKELMPIAQMGEDERETWLKDKERSFRDKKYERRDAADKEAKAKAEQKAVTDALLGRYGIDEDTYAQTERSLRAHLDKTGQKGDVGPEDVVYAQRYVTAAQAIKEAVPHLESHRDYDKILNDVTRQMLEHPSLSREKVQSLLAETWPASTDDRARQKRLSEKALSQAKASGEELPTRKRTEAGEPMFFKDL